MLRRVPVAVPAALVLLVPSGLVFRSHGEAVRTLAVVGGLLVLVAGLLTPRVRVPTRVVEALAGLVMLLGVAASAVYLAGYVHLGWAGTVGLAAVNGALAWMAVRPGARRTSWFVVLALVLSGELGWALAVAHPLVDVAVWTHDGWWALLGGHSPYAITIPDVFDAHASALNYAPAVVGDGRVLEGYPYLPGTLLVDGPGVLLGDDRVVHLALVVAVAALVRSMATDLVGRCGAVLVLLGPLVVPTVVHHWTEPVLALGLTLLVWGMQRARPGAGAVGLALALLSKQYVVVFAPLGRLVVRRLGWRAVAAGAGVAAMVLLGFVAWDPVGFVHSTVWFHSHQLVRLQSVSVTDLLAEHGVDLPGGVSGPGSVLAGLLTAAALSRRVRDPGTWCLVAAAAWTVTVLLSRQGQTNYYWLVSTLLVLGVTLHRDDSAGITGADSTGAPAHRHESLSGRRVRT